MVFLMIARLTEVRWNLNVVLICIFFMARDGEHFFICFLAIWIFSFEKVLFSSVLHFLIGSLVLGEFSFLSSLYILVISPLSNVYSVNIFSHSVGHFFSLEPISFVVQKLLISCSPICLSFLLLAGLLQFYWVILCLYYCFQSIPCSFLY
jgi:hypothetical protein